MFAVLVMMTAFYSSKAEDLAWNVPVTYFQRTFCNPLLLQLCKHSSHEFTFKAFSGLPVEVTRREVVRDYPWPLTSAIAREPPGRAEVWTLADLSRVTFPHF